MCSRSIAMRKLSKGGRLVSVNVGRHVVSCWSKREGMYVGVGICRSAGWWEVTVG